jgi:hypothetical protein
MAAPKFPNVGKKGGPCADKNCAHSQCECIRKIVDSECAYCGSPIGYDTGFYLLGEGEIVHSKCHINALESEPVTTILLVAHRTNGIYPSYN